MPFLRIKTGPNKGKIHEITDAVITLGRDENQTIQILDQGVSRAHAEIFKLGDLCFVRDLNSTNGTFVNSQRITEEALKHADELLIGTTVLAYETSAAPADETSVDLEAPAGADEAKIANTVEIQVDTGRKQTALGREITSRNLTASHKISRIIGDERDLEESMKRVLAVLVEAMGADHAYVFLKDATSGRLVARAAVEADTSGPERKVSRMIVKRVLQTGMPLLTTDAALDDRFMLSESVVLKKIKSVVAAPLMVGDQAVGLVYVHASKTNSSLNVEDLELAATTALQLTMAVSSSRTGERLRGSMFSTIQALVTAMEIIDPRNQGHSQRVAAYAVGIANQMELADAEIDRVRLAALLHDIGKLAAQQTMKAVPRDRLPELHVRAGEKILSSIPGFEEILPGVKYHHERADGSGFPYGLKNADTPLMARIIIVANHFDNLCTEGGAQGTRLEPDAVVKELAQQGGTLFDDDVIKALVLSHRSGALYRDLPAL